ncbi:hypothetical protein [Acanthopleuribacter pedis]|uniref:Uncharacterized protein n=1 Tax=Acanthopleuribacter pedis TaxID=442870 RepID=A0A8J7U7D9_9BACT|nr:hypothetical protein [Acanthopleuribacter pedis]MBO1322408.1 hypothetical protein [Acanthopleuribacter pedis]
MSKDGALIIKGKGTEGSLFHDSFVVIAPDGTHSRTVNIAEIDDAEILGDKNRGRILQNVVKLKNQYLAFVLTTDKAKNRFGDVLTFDENLHYIGRARTYNSQQPPFFRTLQETPNGRFFGLEFWRNDPNSLIFRWSQFKVTTPDSVPVFQKVRRSFQVKDVRLGGIPAAFTRSWIATTADGRTLLAIDELGDMAQKFIKTRSYQLEATLPLTREGFVSYKQATPKKAHDDVAYVSKHQLQYGLSKNTGLYPLEGMDDLFVLGYEVPTSHTEEKLSLVLQIIDSEGQTVLQEDPILGGLFAGMRDNAAVVLAPDLSTRTDSDYQVKLFSYQ